MNKRDGKNSDLLEFYISEIVMKTALFGQYLPLGTYVVCYVYHSRQKTGRSRCVNKLVAYQYEYITVHTDTTSNTNSAVLETAVEMLK